MKFTMSIFIFLIACGQGLSPDQKETDPRDITSINPLFSPYYEEFEDTCGIKVNIPIDFRPIEAPSVGVCSAWVGEKYYGQIGISLDFWEKADEPRKRWLIFHELGHCQLSLAHDESMTDGIPNSIMYPSLPHIAEELLEEGYLRRLCEKV